MIYLVNNKGADHDAMICKLICEAALAFVVCIWFKSGLKMTRLISKHTYNVLYLR